MNKQGRILVVEDREDWRALLVTELQRAHYYVEAVGNIEEALQRLLSTFFHVLILDVRLDDNDTNNLDGFKLLEALEQRRMMDAIKVIILSAFGTKAQIRNAFRDYKVADFVNKTRFKHEDFIEDVKRVFAKDVGANLALATHWVTGSSAEGAVLNMKIKLDSAEKNTRVLPGTPFQKRMAAELEDLLCRLFSEAEGILVKQMSAGRSGATVLSVQPFWASGSGSTVVVKLGDAQKILEEYHNFKEFVERLVGGKRSTGIQVTSRTALLGGIIYTFLGASNQLDDFGAFYRHHDLAEIKKALDHLFLSTCKEWYVNTSRLQLLDLSVNYQQLLHFTPEKLERTLQQLRIVREGGHLYFEALHHQQPFKNPVCAISQSLAFPTYTCPTHGDFNQHNLLVDSDGQIWMIDFQGTRPGHVLRDIAGLDSVIRLQVLSAKDVTLDGFLEMEKALCQISYFAEVEQLAGKFQHANPALMKAYEICTYLRTLAAHHVSHNPEDNFNEYYGALLYHALNTMRFRTLEQEQRECALLSASLLMEKLGL